MDEVVFTTREMSLKESIRKEPSENVVQLSWERYHITQNVIHLYNDLYPFGISNANGICNAAICIVEKIGIAEV